MENQLDRRMFLKGSIATAGVLNSTLALGSVCASSELKVIPSTGEKINPVGMGTWKTFNVSRDERLMYERTKVLSAFFSMGGQMIDSSPMYGSSEAVVGYALSHLTYADNMFSATKTWSHSAHEGRRQFSDSQMLWGQRQLDLVQVHNLIAWEDQLSMLNELKQQKLIRYIGVTTSHGRRHNELAKIMQSQELDFIQLTYNVLDREAEQRLLPLAMDKGIAVIANRPFQGGALFRPVLDKPLPTWVNDFGIHNWAQYFLRFLISHPSVTAVIPATSKVSHMKENMHSVSSFPLPDNQTRQRMLRYLQAI